MVVNRRGIGPGSPGYKELMAIKHRVEQRLRKSPSYPLLEDLAHWRLDQMKEAIAIGDWEGVTGTCQALMRLLAVMPPPPQR